MLVQETVSYLEMTSLSQLCPGRQPPTPIRMEKQSIEDWKLLAQTFVRIGDFVGKGFQTRRIPPWNESQWRERLATTGVSAWLALSGGDVVGFLEIEAQRQGNVEICVFGLVPEFIGRGYGGAVLTRAAEIAWIAEPIDGSEVSRIWLHTSTRDHVAALGNYLNRGFTVFRTETGHKEVIALTWTDIPADGSDRGAWTPPGE